MCCSHSNPHKHLKPGAQGGLLGREGGFRGGIAQGLCTGSPACFWIRLPGGLPIRWGTWGHSTPPPLQPHLPCPFPAHGGTRPFLQCHPPGQEPLGATTPPPPRRPLPRAGSGLSVSKAQGTRRGRSAWENGGSLATRRVLAGGQLPTAPQTLRLFPEPQARAGGRGCCPRAV